MRLPKARVEYVESAEIPALLLALAFSILAMVPFLVILAADLARDLSHDSSSVRYVQAHNLAVKFVGF